MKLSEQWLREWVNPSISLAALAEQLTMAGIEVEAIEPVAGEFSNVMIGEILEAIQHQDAERLRVCTVSIGKPETLQIVCGGANARAGIKVAVAMIGAVLPGDFKIKEAKLRGVLSQGMLCSASELGLAETSEGILELPNDAPVGKELHEWLQLNDKTMELSVTPNRGDCLSIAGIAREVAVLNALTVKPIDIKPVPVSAPELSFPIAIAATADCPHYVGRVIKGINPRATTPMWMQERLRRGGMKCISPVVDITNYVLLELGQPMHAFDLAKLKGQIQVRKAKTGEKLTLLDNQTVELTSETLLITDDHGPLAIAGVMGGLASAVTDQTTDIFLESAYFNPLSIAGKMRQYGLQTDSGYRFERGVDPSLQVLAVERATALLIEIVGGEVGPIIDVTHSSLPVPATIALRRKRITQLLGFNLSDAEIEATLTRLGMTLKSTTEGWEITAPIHRFDIAIEADLIEELVRVKGYENVPLHYPLIQNHLQPASEQKLKLQRVRALLSDRGYREAITYSFVDPRLQQLLLPEQQAIELANPMSSEMSVMRISLWPGLLSALLYNQNRQQDRVRLYETGLCFSTKGGDIIQEMYLSGVVTGPVYPEQWSSKIKAADFFDVKSDLENLLNLSAVEAKYQFLPCKHSALHPGQSAQIIKDGRPIGFLGKIHPEIEQALELQGDVFLFELKLDEVFNAQIPKFNALSKFPSIRRDLAIVVEQSITAQTIQDYIAEEAGAILKHIQLFDVYQGKGIPDGCKSLAIGVVLQHNERTLVEQEVNDLIIKIIAGLKQKFSAVLRD